MKDDGDERETAAVNIFRRLTSWFLFSSTNGRAIYKQIACSSKISTTHKQHYAPSSKLGEDAPLSRGLRKPLVAHAALKEDGRVGGHSAPTELICREQHGVVGTVQQRLDICPRSSRDLCTSMSQTTKQAGAEDDN